MKAKPEKDPRRCADIEYMSMYGSGVKSRCGHFWWDCGPIDPAGEILGEYKELACESTGRLERITMGVINHTAIRGCCSWKPCFDEDEIDDN
jgi:hypothetical protein